MLSKAGDTRVLRYSTYAADGSAAEAGSVVFTLIDPAGASSTPSVTHVAASNEYSIALTFPSAGWWQWTWANTGGTAVPHVEAGSSLVGLSLYQPTPWCTLHDVLRLPAISALTTPDLELLDRSRRAATEFLHTRTWRRFRGLRLVELRPCCRCSFRSVGAWSVWPMNGAGYGRSSPDPAPIMQGPQPCGCSPILEIELPDDVREVVGVTINGAAFTDWRLDAGRMLTRTDRTPWPCCSNVELPDTELNTFSVDVVVGEETADLARLACAELASELFLATAKPTACSIPTKVSSVQTQGQTWTTIDQKTLNEDGTLGLRVCDIFLSAFGKRRKRMIIASPDTPVLGRRIGTGP